MVYVYEEREGLTCLDVLACIKKEPLHCSTTRTYVFCRSIVLNPPASPHAYNGSLCVLLFLSDIPPQFQDKMAQVVGLYPWSDWRQSGFSLPRTPWLLPHCPTGAHLRLRHHPTAHLVDILFWKENEGAVAQCLQTKDYAHAG